MGHTLPLPPGFDRTRYPHRHQTARFVYKPGFAKGWYQDGRKLRNVKTEKAFIWPKDGRNGSTWGRFMDIVTNKGPDIFVAFGAKKTDCLSNGPTRDQWSGHTNLDDRGIKCQLKPQQFAPWTTKGNLGGRAPGLQYDFRTRQYCKPFEGMWTDAIWQPEPYKNRKWNNYPEAVRDLSGQWYQDWQYLPISRNGPNHNEFGDRVWWY